MYTIRNADRVRAPEKMPRILVDDHPVCAKYIIDFDVILCMCVCVVYEYFYAKCRETKKQTKKDPNRIPCYGRRAWWACLRVNSGSLTAVEWRGRGREKKSSDFVGRSIVVFPHPVYRRVRRAVVYARNCVFTVRNRNKWISNAPRRWVRCVSCDGGKGEMPRPYRSIGPLRKRSETRAFDKSVANDCHGLRRFVGEINSCHRVENEPILFVVGHVENSVSIWGQGCICNSRFFFFYADGYVQFILVVDYRR